MYVYIYVVHYVSCINIRCDTFIERLGADLEHHMAVLALTDHPSLAVHDLTPAEHNKKIHIITPTMSK